MFTETELREALEHSADRADAPDHDTGASHRPEPGRQWLLPLVAAASVAALAAGIIAFAGGVGDRSGPADRDATGAATGAASPTVASSTVAAGPLAVVDLVDRAVVGVDAEYRFGRTGDRQTGAQTIRHSLGNGRNDGVMTVDIAPDAAIDADRVQQGERVGIAGTTGWYSALKLYPLDGSTGPGSDKWLPHWTIAFRTPAGDWAFAWIELGINGDDSNLTADDVSVDSTAKIVDAYEKLKVKWTDDGARQLLRFSTLPAGTTLDSASFQLTDGKIDYEGLTFTRGKSDLDVEFSNVPTPTTPQCALPANGSTASPQCRGPVVRKIVAGSVTVTGAGFDDNEQQAVLHGVRTIADPSDYVGFKQAVTP